MGFLSQISTKPASQNNTFLIGMFLKRIYLLILIGCLLVR